MELPEQLFFLIQNFYMQYLTKFNQTTEYNEYVNSVLQSFSVIGQITRSPNVSKIIRERKVYYEYIDELVYFTIELLTH